MIIRYTLNGNQQTSLVFTDQAEFIEKMRSVGATHFGVYDLACRACDAGMRQVDDDGTTEPCNCYLGRQYAELYGLVESYPF